MPGTTPGSVHPLVRLIQRNFLRRVWLEKAAQRPPWGTNPPKPQDAQGLSTKIHAHCLLPAAESNGVALRQDMSRGGQNQRPGKFDAAAT
jgi:hypothetical protein